MIVWIVRRWCPVAEAVQFHSVGPAVAKQLSLNWLHDLLTKHVRWSADHRGRVCGWDLRLSSSCSFRLIREQLSKWKPTKVQPFQLWRMTATFCSHRCMPDSLGQGSRGFYYDSIWFLWEFFFRSYSNRFSFLAPKSVMIIILAASGEVLWGYILCLTWCLHCWLAV